MNEANHAYLWSVEVTEEPNEKHHAPTYSTEGMVPRG